MWTIKHNMTSGNVALDTAKNEREARRKAAAMLGVATLRGLVQTPTERGTLVMAPGASEDGESVEMYR